MLFQGFIYKLVSNQTPQIYIGSTFKNLEWRFKKHQSHYRNYINNCSEYNRKSFELLQYPDCKIELIKECMVANRADLHIEENLAMIFHKDIIVNKFKAHNANRRTYTDLQKNYYYIYNKINYLKSLLKNKISISYNDAFKIRLTELRSQVMDIVKKINSIDNAILLTEISDIKKLVSQAAHLSDGA